MTGGLAVVTGASGGLGAAIATRLHRTGRPLLLLARRREEMARLGLDGALLAAVDVRDEDAVAEALGAATARFGPVETLVNNAGVLRLGDLASQPVDDWRATLEVNVLAVVGVTRQVLPAMLERQSGTIVVVSSLGARQVFAHESAYCASKAAVHAMCEALRLEAAPYGVRVIEIAPGLVETALVDSTTDAQLRDRYLAGRRHALDPEAVAEVVGLACDLPQDVCVRELHVAHTRQA
ncbi:SDR family oxidoreductase [Blastococcus saxobsidens]|uniref:Putative oxidoreductase n=1 Tax=Blastococcus saxobsidens (strain DD2) TaxID=1146883 RepID=H6RQK3_BLASD|nr:SDR family oxidoreductase [Blastococcus saxobsidens]CCG05371.1 putative oxidoreductase [Blastococcus saxobsidens DD2]